VIVEPEERVISAEEKPVLNPEEQLDDKSSQSKRDPKSKRESEEHIQDDSTQNPKPSSHCDPSAAPP